MPCKYHPTTPAAGCYACENARLKEELAALGDKKCSPDECCHVSNSAEATTQCLEYQGQIAVLTAERDALQERCKKLENALLTIANRQSASIFECAIALAALRPVSGEVK